MNRILLLLIPLFAALPGLPGGAAAAADQVTLKNGDRLTGTVVRSDEKKLLFKTEYAGEVSIDWTAVETISSSEPLHLLLKDGQAVVGTVTTQDGALRVQTKETGLVTTDKAAVQAIRSVPEQASYEESIERLRNPRLLDLWTGFLDTGLATTRGNAETTTINLTMNAARVTPRDKISTYFTSLYATNSTTGESIATAKAIRGGIKYEMNINEKLFGFGFTDLEFDEFQRLDLRFVSGGGLGYHVIKNESTMLDLFTGGSLNKEFFSTGINRTAGEILFGDEFNYKVLRGTSIRQRAVIFPNISETGAYRITFDLGTVTAINKWLGWQFTISDRYLSNPPPGTRKNDILITTGLRLTFAR
jgi:putative salt-induced outer membrane protein YdiY